MTILDRYILKQFFLNFAILFAVLFLFSCMADLFVNLERFVDAAREIERLEAQDERAEAEARGAATAERVGEGAGPVSPGDADSDAPDFAGSTGVEAGGAGPEGLAEIIGTDLPQAVEEEAMASPPDLTTTEAPASANDFASIGADAAEDGGEAPDLALRIDRLQRVAWMVIDFYWPRLFQFYAFLFGVVVIGATGFTLVQFHRHRELTAVLAAGVSLHRVALPLILAAIGLNILQFANREFMLPRLAPMLLRSHGELGQRELSGFRAEFVTDSLGRVFYGREYRPDEQRMDHVIIWVQNPDGTVDTRIEADSAQWKGDGWALTNGRAVQVSRDVNRNLDRHGTLDYIPSDLDPETLLLRRYQQFRQMLSLRQIAELSARESMFSDEQRALFERVRYGRFAQFLVNMFAFLIALPFFLIREPRNLLVQAVMCASVSLTAQIVGGICTVVGLPGVPPAASVFIFPLLILLPVAAAFMSNVKT